MARYGERGDRRDGRRPPGAGRGQPAPGPARRRRLGTVPGRPGHRAAAGDVHPLRRVGRLGRRHQGHAADAAGHGRAAAADRPVRHPGPQLLPRLRQRDAVAAAARRDREAPVRAGLVVRLPGRERDLRRPGAGRARRAAGRDRVGARLPPDAGPAAHPRPPPGPADRVLPARALAVAGHLRPAAVAGADPGRAARGGRGVVPHRALPEQLRARVRAAAGRLGHRGARERGSCCPTAGWWRPRPRPSRSTRASSPGTPPRRRRTPTSTR